MFKHRKKLIEHEQIDHNNECDDIIENESEAEEEMENNESEICENTSDKTFNNPSQEHNHLTGKTFKCNTCNFEVATKPELVEHKSETHHW